MRSFILNKTILIVDDEMPTRTLFRIMLQGAGYDTIEAEDGAEALTIIAQEKPDVVLLDVMMPNMDGFAVCKALRADKNTANLPILMFSADTSSTTSVKGMEAGASMFLTKPVPRPKLLQILENVFATSPTAS